MPPHRSLEQTDRTTSYDGERHSDGLRPAAIPDRSAGNRLKLRSASELRQRPSLPAAQPPDARKRPRPACAELSAIRHTRSPARRSGSSRVAARVLERLTARGRADPEWVGGSVVGVIIERRQQYRRRATSPVPWREAVRSCLRLSRWVQEWIDRSGVLILSGRFRHIEHAVCIQRIRHG